MPSQLMLNTLQTTDIKDKELLLSKRDCHAAIAAFSFCLRAVNFENGCAVLPFPRLLYEGKFQINLEFEHTNLPVYKAIK